MSKTISPGTFSIVINLCRNSETDLRSTLLHFVKDSLHPVILQLFLCWYVMLTYCVTKHFLQAFFILWLVLQSTEKRALFPEISRLESASFTFSQLFTTTASNSPTLGVIKLKIRHKNFKTNEGYGIFVYDKKINAQNVKKSALYPSQIVIMRLHMFRTTIPTFLTLTLTVFKTLSEKWSHHFQYLFVLMAKIIKLLFSE